MEDVGVRIGPGKQRIQKATEMHSELRIPTVQNKILAYKGVSDKLYIIFLWVVSYTWPLDSPSHFNFYWRS